MAKRKQKKYHGHYCWCCDRVRPHEKFSGKGHARHLCKSCARIGVEELAYRQALRNLERCMNINLIIPRQHRRSFNRFLTHKDPRIRAIACQMQDIDAQTRAEWRAMRRQEQEIEYCLIERWMDHEALSQPAELSSTMDCEAFDDDEHSF